MLAALLIQMFLIAQNDPDAFDMDNLRDQGTYNYMCLQGEYSAELNKLCLDYKTAVSKPHNKGQ